MPAHLEGPVFEANKDTAGAYEKNTLYVTDATNPGLYNGPYRVQEIQLGSHVVLIPNEQWFGQKPYFEKVILKLIPNTQALEANLLSGEIDMISNLGLTLDQSLAFEKRVKEQNLPFEVIYKPGLLYEHIDLQLKNPILQDLNVRKALVYAIDRDALSQALFEGKQPKAIHNIAPIDRWYTDDPTKIVLYEYSPRKARSMLDDAGWTMGDDGYRYKDGQKLSLQLMTTAGNKTRELVEAWLQEEWKKVGIEITIKNEPARVYFGETVRCSKFEALAMFAWFSAPENTPRSTFHSSNIPTDENGCSGQNDPAWVNKDVDALIDEIDVTFDHEKRVELIAKVLYHYTNEVPVIPLYYRATTSVVPNNFAGYEMSPHQFSEANEVEFWHLTE
jgi:peptide/nickel transport system substrate-binding protein